ncbi:MAG: transglycosylase [Alphaproteobacteria bacterium]|nr:transglycosylase [Alphaproteobacteria bacterium]|tara:strand:+ start:1282 stop:3177 length:1896 start_codon:yes stop_codon:yes gene_type:complete
MFSSLAIKLTSIYQKVIIRLIAIIFLLILNTVIYDPSIASDIRKYDKQNYFPGKIIAERKNNIIKLLPKILNKEEASKYKRIFSLQEQGKLELAAQIISELNDPVLMGHVLAQKYMHPTAYRSKFSELRDWLKYYSDHPDASRIYKLAMRRKPKNTLNPKSPKLGVFGEALPLSANKNNHAKIPTKKLSKIKKTELKKIQRNMRARLRRGWPTGALEILNSPKHISLASNEEISDYRARIAWSYYIYNKDKLAMDLSAQSALQSRAYVPTADWTAGLSSWRLGDFKNAKKHFEFLANNPHSDQWIAAAGAFWASRASLKIGQPKTSTQLLRRAALTPYVFYGLLAKQILGSNINFKWHISNPSKESFKEAVKFLPLKRAIALYESGQFDLAKKEIHKIRYRATPEMGKLLIILATALKLPDIETEMGIRLYLAKSIPNYDFAMYPIPSWIPEDNFKVDPALIFALIRQESRFKTSAKSKRGARGLMQIMPRTAKFTAKRLGLKNITNNKLKNPEINIMIGQAYLKHLMSDEVVGKNLLFTLAAYNAGPGNLRKWLPKTNYDDDPLLFLESTRSRETRHFIRVVLTNYWIYQMQMGLELKSLNQMAAGSWPFYSDNIEKLEFSYDSKTRSRR